MTRLSLLPLVALLAAGPAGAQALPPDMAPRYVFVPVENGALRLNTGTGEVSLCTGAKGAGTCDLLPDEARESSGEIARLRDEVNTLEARIAALEARPPEAGVLSDAESLDRVLDLADRMMRRFVGMVRDIKEDAERGEL